MIKKIIFLFTFVCSCLNSVEVTLESFQGYKGHFLTASPLNFGKIDNNFLHEHGINIEITKLDAQAGVVELELVGELGGITSIELVPFSESKIVDSFVTDFQSKQETDKTIITYKSDTELGKDSYLKFNFSHPWDLKSYPYVTLFVKGEELIHVNQYQVKIIDARDDLGTNLQLFNPPHYIYQKDFLQPFNSLLSPSEKDEVIVSFQINEVPQNAKKIDYIKGEIIFETSQVKELSFNLALGQIQDPELEKNGIELNVTQLTNNEVRIDYLNPQNKELRIQLDTRGEPYQHLSQRMEIMNNGSSNFVAKSDLPIEKIGLKVILSDSNPSISVPFELKNLLLRNPRQTWFW